MVTGDNIRILLISVFMSGNVFRAKPKVCQAGDKQEKNLGNEKNFQTHISDRFVSLVHHLHQLLRSVIKDILNVSVSGSKL